MYTGKERREHCVSGWVDATKLRPSKGRKGKWQSRMALRIILSLSSLGLLRRVTTSPVFHCAVRHHTRPCHVPRVLLLRLSFSLLPNLGLFSPNVELIRLRRKPHLGKKENKIKMSPRNSGSAQKAHVEQDGNRARSWRARRNQLRIPCLKEDMLI